MKKTEFKSIALKVEKEEDEEDDDLEEYKIVKDKKNQMKSSKCNETIFSCLRLNYDELDQQILKQNYVYATDFNYLIEKYTSKENAISFNYPGGCVIPIKRKLFAKKNEILCHVCDYTSLYPSVMILHNNCQTTMCTNPKFKIKIGDNFYSPFDEKYFHQVCVPLKINSFLSHIIVFITKVEHQVSDTSQILASLNFERKEAKKKSALALKNDDQIEYYVHHYRQLAIKVTTNALYGITNSLHKASFRPYIASIVCLLGRLHLLRFFLHFLNYYKTRKILLEQRDVLYGDTDSLFLICTLEEMVQIIRLFSLYKFHNNNLNIELEKTASKAVFLASKSYILEVDSSKQIYAKSIFTKSKSQPTKTFLSDIISFIFNEVIKTNDEYCDVKLLDNIFKKYNSTSDLIFKNGFKMSKDLTEYKSNTQQIIQLRHLSKLENISFLKGTKIEYTHYDFIFKEGPYYGPIDYNNSDQIKYLNNVKNKTCTILINNMLEYYKEIFNIFKINISKKRIFELDTNAIMTKLFNCLKEYPNFKQNFLKSKQNVFQNNDLNDDEEEFNDYENNLINETMIKLCSRIK